MAQWIKVLPWGLRTEVQCLILTGWWEHAHLQVVLWIPHILVRVHIYTHTHTHLLSLMSFALFLSDIRAHKWSRAVCSCVHIKHDHFHLPCLHVCPCECICVGTCIQGSCVRKPLSLGSFCELLPSYTLRQGLSLEAREPDSSGIPVLKWEEG